jgi:hypothetical protein
MTAYYPKVSRCAGCSKLKDDCSRLPFSTMPVHRRDGADVIVICSEFRQRNHGASLRHESRPGRGRQSS